MSERSTAVDVDALRRELERDIEGEVRFDAITRALYSTDASVYQIEPLGVVVVKSRDDLVRTVAACRRHRCPLTMRGGGTSQAGQAIGGGIVVDTSKYFNRLLEVNVAARWARVEPGIVLDELNARLRQEGLRFAPDISTASRATVGGMMANNSSGARSVIYGKTIDHVIEQQVVLSDGSLAHFRPLDAGELEAMCAQQTLEGQCYRQVRQIVGTCAEEIERRYPKVLRRVGGYNLDAFLGPTAPFNMAKLLVGSEGTLGVVVEAKLALVPLPKFKSVLTIQFADLLEALAATPAILAHAPVGDRDNGSLHPGPYPPEPGDRTDAPNVHRGRSGGAAVRRDVFRDSRRSAATPRRARARSGRARIRLPVSPGARPAGAERDLVGARSGARTVDGHERGRQVAVVRRGHRRGARAAARLHRALSRNGTAAMARRRVSMRMPRSAACTCGRS